MGPRGMRRRGAQRGGPGGPRAAPRRACGHRARRAAPSRPSQHPALWSRQRPRRPIELARVKQRALGQAVRGDGPGMQLQMREGPPGLSAGKTQPPGNVPATVVIAEWVCIKQHDPRCCIIT